MRLRYENFTVRKNNKTKKKKKIKICTKRKDEGVFVGRWRRFSISNSQEYRSVFSHCWKLITIFIFVLVQDAHEVSGRDVTVGGVGSGYAPKTQSSVDDACFVRPTSVDRL